MAQDSSNNSRNSKPLLPNSPRRSNLLQEDLDLFLAHPRLPKADKAGINRLKRLDDWEAVIALLRRRAVRAFDAMMAAAGEGKDPAPFVFVLSELHAICFWAEQPPVDRETDSGAENTT